MPHPHRTTTPGRARRRLTAALAAGALGATTLAAPVGAQQAGARDTTTMCWEEPWLTDQFGDIAGTTFEAEITCLATMGGVSGGVGGRPSDRFSPELDVSRAQMATYAVQLGSLADHRQLRGTITPFPPPSEAGPFRDVAGNAHVGSINALAAAGVVRGGIGGADPDVYGPDAPVDRAQMATYLVMTLEHLLGTDLDAPAATYRDVPAGHVHRPAIDVVTSLGIAQGYPSGAYGPDEPISRGQMAAMALRAAAYLYDEGHIQNASFFSPLVDVRTGTPAPGTERITFDFARGVPMHRVHLVEGPFVEDGSGDEVDVAGDAFLLVQLHPSSLVDHEGDPAGTTYPGPRRFDWPGSDTVVEIVNVSDFEGTLTWVIGLTAPVDVEVSTVQDATTALLHVDLATG